MYTMRNNLQLLLILSENHTMPRLLPPFSRRNPPTRPLSKDFFFQMRIPLPPLFQNTLLSRTVKETESKHISNPEQKIFLALRKKMNQPWGFKNFLNIYSYLRLFFCENMIPSQWKYGHFLVFSSPAQPKTISISTQRTSKTLFLMKRKC